MLSCTRFQNACKKLTPLPQANIPSFLPAFTCLSELGNGNKYFLLIHCNSRKKKKQNKSNISGFSVQSQLWPTPYTPVSLSCTDRLVLFSTFGTTFPEMHTVSFKVHFTQFLSCSRWLTFTTWKCSFPDVTKSACSDSAVS